MTRVTATIFHALCNTDTLPVTRTIGEGSIQYKQRDVIWYPLHEM